MESILNGKKNKTSKDHHGGTQPVRGGGVVKQKEETIRLEIELHQPTDQKTNEISYAQLLNAKTKKKVRRADSFQKERTMRLLSALAVRHNTEEQNIPFAWRSL